MALPGQIGWTFDAANPTYTLRQPHKSPAKRPGRMVIAYLWSRTILCPWCTGLIPLSPQWKLSPQLGLRLTPGEWRTPRWAVVPLAEMSYGTVKGGIANCIYCGGTTPRGYVHSEAQAENVPPSQAGRLGHLQYCIVYKNYALIYRKWGKPIVRPAGMEYVVPGNVGYESWVLRYDCLVAKGQYEAAMADDPTLREILDDDLDPDTAYAPGL